MAEKRISVARMLWRKLRPERKQSAFITGDATDTVFIDVESDADTLIRGDVKGCTFTDDRERSAE
jgi:hypothetical protein